MELVTVFTRAEGDGTITDRFKIGANVRDVTAEEIGLNNFELNVGDIRVTTGISSLSKQIVPGNWVRLFDGTEYKVQDIANDRIKGKIHLFADGPRS